MQESDITKNTDMTTTGIDDTFSSTAVMKSKDKQVFDMFQLA